ncbi:MAG: DEAD/DEAH box helicase, partial [Clostridia bacterium]|nr:DEAD/DEAH box helicase [Clostridia bacterium]
MRTNGFIRCKVTDGVGNVAYVEYENKWNFDYNQWTAMTGKYGRYSEYEFYLDGARGLELCGIWDHGYELPTPDDLTNPVWEMLFDYIDNLTSDLILRWRDNVRGGLPTAVFGVTESARYYLPFLTGESFLYIAKDALSAKKTRDEMSALTGKDIVYLPAKDDVLLYKKFLNKDNLFDRITALYAIENGAEYVVTTMEALMQPFPRHLPSAKYFVAREYPLDGVVKTLVDLGYKRKEFADEKGDFALRGDILEVFPINEERAVRCEFFGDEIERMRFIDENRQSGEEVRSFFCLPTVDFFIDRAEIENLRSTLDRSRKKFKTLLPRGRADAVFNEITDTLECGALTDVNLSFLYPLLGGVTNDISEIFPKCKAIIFDEPKLVADGAERVFAEHTSRYESLLAGGEVFDFSFDNLKTPSFVAGKFKVACHSIQNINSVNKLVNPLDTIRLRVSPVSKYQRDLEQLPVDVKNWKAAGYSVIIACGNEKRRDDIAAFLDKWGVEALGVTSNGITKGKCYVVSDYYSDGFILHDDKSVVVGSLDLYVSGIKEKRIKKRRNDNFSAPEVGDFAVHETYGIGLVRGVERITTTDGSKDYVALEYYGGDYMYVPTEQMDKLTKYLGGEKSPMLSRLGGGEFEKIKERVRRSISEMKINLKKLYGERASKKGFAFSADNEMTEQFEGAFGYDLTEDQAQSVYEIKRDMESDKIMDRLLLGDVGFGKTEVALRACFKAVMDGKQVALVAPTTILTEQHYQTIKERFKDFAVTSCVLNRFQSPKKIRENLKKIQAGEIDIVVGTHRIFGKDVKFHDLGLLVLDEEQRFGVEHKEKLRLIQNSVDTLTMSATPIPRTLHMSLSGIRDISLINTPPSKRIPVQAYVTEESETLIRDAVLKELS